LRIDLKKPGRRLAFYRSYRRFKRQAERSKEAFAFGRLYPCLNEMDDQSGTASGHYFHQDLLVAQNVFQDNPERHVDIGSRIDGFVAHVASFREIEVFDVRPLESNIRNIRFRQVDLMQKGLSMPDYSPSISCLHALEHFGLGRYGDELDFEGHLRGFENIYRMLKPGGKFYFSVPIGEQRIEFNAHRVFSIRYLLDLVEPRYDVTSFSYVDDRGDLIKDKSLDPGRVKGNFGCNYGCGIFELRKK